MREEDELDPETDEVVGYLASEESRAAMLIRAAMNYARGGGAD